MRARPKGEGRKRSPFGNLRSVLSLDRFGKPFVLGKLLLKALPPLLHLAIVPHPYIEKPGNLGIFLNSFDFCFMLHAQAKVSSHLVEKGKRWYTIFKVLKGATADEPDSAHAEKPLDVPAGHGGAGYDLLPVQ